MAYEWNSQFVKGFGLRLRNRRQENGMTIEELSEKSGVNYSQIGRIERGMINTTIHTAYILSKSLGVNISELFDFDPEQINREGE